MTPTNLGSRLHDIHDLDRVGFWPMAPGWWMLLAGALVLVLLTVVLRRYPPKWRRLLPRRGWARMASHELMELKADIDRVEAKHTAAHLSELLRRIAIARCGRHRCAGLQGESWLAWLREHDPEGFDWLENGRALLDLPYAPPGGDQKREELLQLIDAALAWTTRAGSCAFKAVPAHGV